MSNKNNKKQTEQLTKKVLEAVPELKSESNARKVVRMVSQQVTITSRSGPYPSPEEYEHYHKIDPELTALMKKMVVEEQKHEHDMDKRYLEKDFKLRRRGQWFAFSVFVSVVALGAYALFNGFEWGGAVITALGVGGIVAQFLKRR